MTKMLFLRAHSLAEWRELGQTTHATQLARLLQQAKSYESYLPPAEHPRDSITYIGMAVANMALAYLLTEEKSYLDSMRKWLKVGIEYPSWGLARKPNHDLDAAWLLFGFGLAYAWVGEALPEDERVALRDKLIWQCIQIYNYALATETHYWGSAYWQNHNWICYGGLATTAAALLDDYADAQVWLDRAVENFKIVLPLWPEDGSDYEGVVYWRYGFPWLLIPAHLLQEECGVDLHQSEFLRQSFHHRLHLGGPNLVDTANFGDCHDRRSAHSRMVLYRLASLYNIGEAQWLAEHFEQTGEWEREGREGLVKPGLLPEAWLDFVWFDPSVEMKPLEGMESPNVGTTAVFPDMGLLTTRSSWQADATYLAFKCGTPNGARGWHLGQAIDRKNDWDVIKASHEHPDENSFILMRGDDYLTVDPGYSRNKLTRNHNTLLVDGKGQYNEGGYNAFDGLDQAWGGRLQEWFTASGLTYVQGEAAGAYAAELGLTQYSRQMLMLDADTIVVCDDIRLTTARKLEWLLQTDHAAQQVGDRAWRIIACPEPVEGAETHALRVDALEPQAIAADQWEQEISANPTSAKPDWIITRHQHTLVLSPEQPTTQARYFVILSFAEPNIEQLDCQFGSAAQIGNTLVAFASGRHHMRIADRLTTDAAWCAVGDDVIVAGSATNLWENGRLQLLASSPSDIALMANGCTVSAKRPTWVSCAVAKQPRAVQIDNKEIETKYNAELGLLRFQVPAGQVQVDWH